MKLIKRGKTKDVFETDDHNYLLVFKDTVTGHIGGEKDPGGNSVVGEVEGTAFNALKVTDYYFKLIRANKIPTHFISCDPAAKTMLVRPAKMFGNGLEFVLRYVAAGSFIRRFGGYCREGQELPEIFEVTLKDDDRNDPPISRSMLDALNIMTAAQYDACELETKRICKLIKDDLSKRGLTLYDIKLEFGIVDGKVMLIDEISGGNMRVYRNGKKLSYDELSELF